MMTTVSSDLPKQLSLGGAQTKLVNLWRWGLLPVFIVGLQTITGKYGTRWPDFLDGIFFVLPLIGPVLGIIYFASRALKSNKKRQQAACNMALFRHFYILSVVFIFAVTAILILQPWMVQWKPKELIAVANLLFQPFSMWLIGMAMVFFLTEPS
jgi:hypothetical protein